jgi:hypothetical protein
MGKDFTKSGFDFGSDGVSHIFEKPHPFRDRMKVSAEDKQVPTLAPRRTQN